MATLKTDTPLSGAKFDKTEKKERKTNVKGGDYTITVFQFDHF